jgi:hypothetical protein
MEISELLPSKVGNIGWFSTRHNRISVAGQQQILQLLGKQ